MTKIASTKDRLLDAAEEVFARVGYRAASLRVITSRAAVNLAAVNYHYGSKPELLEAVFARRLQAMNQARVLGLTLALEAARGAGRRPQTRTLLEAFVAATLEHARSGDGERNFMALVLRSLSDTDHTVQRAFESFMKPTFDALHAAMSEALPALPASELRWRLQFAIGAMIRLHHLSLADEPAGSRSTGPAVPEVINLFTDFVNAGLCAPPAAPPRRRQSAQGEHP